MTVKRIKLYISILTLMLSSFCAKQVFAQDPVYTQFYLAPLQINPAFAGNTYAPIVRLNTRVEWPSIGLAYNTYSFSVDRFYKANNFGAGVFVTMDNSGNGIYKRFRLEGIFSYRLNVSENKFMKLGMSAAFGQNRLDWGKLVFGDQIDPRFGYTLPDGSKIPSKEIQPNNLSVNYLDVSAGVLFYSKELYLGIAIKHGNTPVDYYFNSQTIVNTGLPVRLTIQLGGELDMFPSYGGRRSYYSPSLLYVSQSGLNQFVLNNYFDLGSVFAGIGYRWNVVNSDAVLFSIGVNKDMFKISYSFDYTISNLSIGSGGSHEIGIAINFDKSTLFEAPYRYSDCFNMFR